MRTAAEPPLPLPPLARGRRLDCAQAARVRCAGDSDCCAPGRPRLGFGAGGAFGALRAAALLARRAAPRLPAVRARAPPARRRSNLAAVAAEEEAQDKDDRLFFMAGLLPVLLPEERQLLTCCLANYASGEVGEVFTWRDKVLAHVLRTFALPEAVLSENEELSRTQDECTARHNTLF
jgi:hypothetical protein